ncbi:EAL domain-containing protein [Balneatrix alpica]|uniref:EAL domain-containing protein n=1 Tax=Balneatrix alpica TaxID=75684 RepID=A0ABV5ZEV1_9GAMM|nr:EAL domain-containing protein [Balneatrix alpica]
MTTLRLLLRTLREGMVWILPAVVVDGLVFLLIGLLKYFAWLPELVEVLIALRLGFAGVLPLLLSGGIGYMLALHLRLPRAPVTLLCLCYSAISNTQLAHPSTDLLVGILTPLYAVPLLSQAYKRGWGRLLRHDLGGLVIKDSVNLIVPALWTLLAVTLVGLLLGLLFHHGEVWQFLRLEMNQPWLAGALYSLLNSLSWFVGIHGYYALLPLAQQLAEASSLNAEAAQAGLAIPSLVSSLVLEQFVFIGGSGATLGLAFALLWQGKQAAIRTLACLGLLLGAFNINEVLLFGLPLIFNPRFLLPFILAPQLCWGFSYWLLANGWVALPVLELPFSAPVFFNVFLTTDGQWQALLLQLLNLLLSTLLYLPFVMSWQRDHADKTIAIPALETSYARRWEEAGLLASDAVADANRQQQQQLELDKQMDHIGELEFYLEYQPQIGMRDGRIIGCEALIRARNAQGKQEGPGQFLPWLAQAGMMKDVDRWTIREVLRQQALWQQQGQQITVSINITPETLEDERLIQRLLPRLAPFAEQLVFEITEGTLARNQPALKRSLDALRALGVRLHIDDFGTGYSSLSYLGVFSIDAIKIDRSFVQALAHSKGQQLFRSLLEFAEQLEVEVVVEGVETAEQLHFVPQGEHISAQGWYYSRSLPANEFMHLLTQFNSSRPPGEDVN